MTAVVVFTAVAAGPAQAAKGSRDVDRLVRALHHTAPDVLIEATVRRTDPRGRHVAVDADEPTAELSLGDVIVALPVGKGAVKKALPNGDAAIVGVDSTFAAVEKTDGSVQVIFTVENAQAPTEFPFAIEPVAGATFQVLENGSAWYVAADGALIVGAAPPWAKDAAGADVPTWFDVHDNTLVQIVDHRTADVAYPVVADPWLGIDLFSKVTHDTYNRQLRVNLTKRGWGHAMHTPTAAGIDLFLNAGWKEAKAKSGRLEEKGTLRQQYECHVWGGYGNLAGTWNLEKFRPTRTRTWYYGVLVHRCNWTTARGY